MQRPCKKVSPVLEEHFRFLLWLVPVLERFPRSQRLVLGDRIQTLGQEILECLIEANYSRERRHHLARANMALDKLRYFIRMSVELKHLDHRRYEFAARSIDEIGRQIGGWMKASHGEAPR